MLGIECDSPNVYASFIKRTVKYASEEFFAIASESFIVFVFPTLAVMEDRTFEVCITNFANGIFILTISLDHRRSQQGSRSLPVRDGRPVRCYGRRIVALLVLWIVHQGVRGAECAYEVRWRRGCVLQRRQSGSLQPG